MVRNLNPHPTRASDLPRPIRGVIFYPLPLPLATWLLIEIAPRDKTQRVQRDKKGRITYIFKVKGQKVKRSRSFLWKLFLANK